MPDDEGLQVQQPERRQKHQGDDNFQEGKHEPIAEGGRSSIAWTQAKA